MEHPFIIIGGLALAALLQLELLTLYQHLLRLLDAITSRPNPKKPERP